MGSGRWSQSATVSQLDPPRSRLQEASGFAEADCSTCISRRAAQGANCPFLLLKLSYRPGESLHGLQSPSISKPKLQVVVRDDLLKRVSMLKMLKSESEAFNRCDGVVMRILPKIWQEHQAALEQSTKALPLTRAARPALADISPSGSWSLES